MTFCFLFYLSAWVVAAITRTEVSLVDTEVGMVDLEGRSKRKISQVDRFPDLDIKY